MAARGVPLHFEVVADVAEGLSDHTPILCRLLSPPITAQSDAPPCTQQYKWVAGDDLDTYCRSWQAWERLGNDDAFVQRFTEVVDNIDTDLEAGVHNVEQFLLREAIAAGVVRATAPHKCSNPNQVAKHMAPWFNETCHMARREFKQHLHSKGRGATATKAAFTRYKQCCRLATT